MNSDADLSPASVAFALILCRSRPQSLEIEGEIVWPYLAEKFSLTGLTEYITQLRAHVVLQKSTSDVVPKSLDTIAYWRRQYEHSEEDKTKLQDKVYELEQKCLLTGNDGLLQPSLQAGKKTKREEPTTKANSQMKRRAPDTTAEPMGRSPDAIPYNSLQLRTGSETMLHYVFELQRLSLTPRPNPEKLIHSIRALCHAMNRMVISSIDKASLSTLPANAQRVRTSAAQPPSEVLTTIRNIHLIMIKAAGKGERYAETSLAQIVSAITSTVSLLLCQLHALCILQASQQNSRRDIPIALTRQHTAICNSLGQTVAHLMTALDFNNTVNEKIFQGYVSLFFEHLGSALSFIVFSNPEIGIEPGVRPPQGLIDAEDLPRSSAMRAAQLEAPYLIRILEKAMGVIDAHQSLLSSDSPAFLSVVKSSTTTNGAFASAIRQKLQNTMLRGVFGDDDAFQNALPRSTPLEDVADVDIWEEDPTTPEWFVDKVWQSLGWGILAQR